MKLGIYGYGNLGRGVENAIKQNKDISLEAVFTRRDPALLRLSTPNAKAEKAENVKAYIGKLDALIICGGSATDLPEMTPMLAKMFHVIDSYDNHSTIPQHAEKVNAAAMESGHVALISCGWDPGLFSLMRLLGNAALPSGADYTFWGRGVSQGHSDAIRRIEGVQDARQYTVPVESAIARVRGGETPELTAREKHTRECYVVAKPDADLARIEREIKTMPAYFEPYDTTVHFISQEELNKNHKALPHGGHAIRVGSTGASLENRETMDFSLNLDSNPEFTGSVLVAYARAVCRMAARGEKGVKTVFDIAPIDLLPVSREEAIAHLL